ncbi:MAG TPA: hypothetical protein VGZ89_00925 [Xanthobacteraceae bacterium]|jgi:hypothetical protein|nr:hypothetical protein [Xanthobacteraceae bacterium]
MEDPPRDGIARKQRRYSVTTDNKRRILGELVFLYGDAEVEAAGSKLRNAGFYFKITDDVDQCSDATRFMILWRDELDPTDADDLAVKRFEGDVEALIGELADNVGVVEPDFVPAHFGG